ncbi:5'-methylthioadenosine/S-adenosylhomocysteine nucleosidase family protein [Aspergillus vadensis CBS 113365]|uniref:Purine and uridine phosphorylase n=1 Tax=Aspergillus vadensis (strain CBS 113365 / IMI 142717 / IBT 24658) TaxID=1448311 RepID=A0A319BPA3_ASPVC|nr:purine and uridine phosphorylase [Aspergillus vadensis CBS 113365]PYH65028.1 purine and uridine phosphorylase [Aspergillus vadensis CBS 113365]
MALSRDYTVGIFCPLEVEICAVQYLLDKVHRQTQSRPVRYVWGKLGDHNVVVATLPFTYRGKVSTAVAVARLHIDFPNISRLLLVGIGGGVPTQGVDVRLGDVVIGTPTALHPGVVQYDLGKRYKGKFVRTGYLPPPPEEWIHAITKMKTSHLVQGDQLSSSITALEARSAHRAFIRPPPELDTLFEPTYDHIDGATSCDQCSRDRVTQRPPRSDPTKPVIHYGLILSGDSVIKDAATRDQIASDEGGAICFEMEAAAMMNDFPCLVIRGICDYADSHKNDVWHEYAAAAAAAVAKEILRFIEPTVPRIEDDHNSSSAGTVSSNGAITGTFYAQNGTITNIQTMTAAGNIYFG